jgi:hypothetical protein
MTRPTPGIVGGEAIGMFEEIEDEECCWKADEQGISSTDRSMVI